MQEPISLTDFVDFAILPPSRQAAKVREIVNRGAYDPRFDFWKRLRETIQKFHQDGGKLEDALTGLTDPKKIRLYPSAVKSYSRLMKKLAPLSFTPPRGIWTYGDLKVKVNPEVGLVVNEKKYVVKLYFKDEKPTQRKLKLVFELMRNGLDLDNSMTPTVIDVSKGKPIFSKSVDQEAEEVLEAVSLAFCHLWKKATAKRKAAAATTSK